MMLVSSILHACPATAFNDLALLSLAEGDDMIVSFVGNISADSEREISFLLSFAYHDKIAVNHIIKAKLCFNFEIIQGYPEW